MKQKTGFLSGWLSELFYRSIDTIDSWLGLPESVSKTLLYRRHWQHYLSSEALSSSSKSAIWVHGASVGELEDLAGLFLDLKRLGQLSVTPESLILTGSSASVENRLKQWNQRMNFRFAGPLPPENSREIDSFISLLRPKILVISQNDLWPQLLNRLNHAEDFRGIIWLPAGKEKLPKFTDTLRQSKLLGVGFRSQADLNRWRHRFPDLQSDLRIIGNPRIDRILSRIQDCVLDPEGHILTDYSARPNPEKLSIILGSAWRDDAEIWRRALDIIDASSREKIQLVVLPHDADNLHEVASIRQLLPEARVLALEGVLLESYQDFKIAYVGGGFGAGLHNILEPLLWKIPIVSGPKISNQSDAERLRSEGTLQVISNPRELADLLKNSLSDIKSDSPDFFKNWENKAIQDSLHFEESRGAIDRLGTFIHDLSSNGGIRERH